MTRRLPLVLGALALAALLGGALVFGLREAVVTPPAPEPRAAAPSPAASAPGAPAPALKPRAGRALPLDAALRELDLIRPSRQKAADDFTLPLADGAKFRLSGHRGRPVFINFWATWCPPCREEMPAMERLWRHQKDNGLVMVAVSLDADPAVVKPFIAEHGFTFPVALDPRLEVANVYGVRALPSSFLVDARGALAALALGPRVWDNDAAHSLIEALVAR
jgi:peroxiredoxin